MANLLPNECGGTRRRPATAVEGESCEDCMHATDINQGDGSRSGWCKLYEEPPRGNPWWPINP